MDTHSAAASWNYDPVIIFYKTWKANQQGRIRHLQDPGLK